jgi:glycosyltransferase involved in cell wall biosynthesis
MQKRALKKCGNNIIFAGHRSDILEIYPDLDIAVHPSRSENFGGSMESLSKGVPTITTDVGGFPELIKEGVTGYMVKAGKPKELADKILYVAEHYGEAKEIALNGQRFITGINNELSLKQITGIYETILKSSGDSK